ncbi:hypothetical protein KVV02_004879 [Mortierella alpina]|uniref:Kinetochore protein fta7 n=1 Tax=Mortierella alpina TaxID=64518 RepID=A0A9P8A742_MORAP|nr:hypothetical protein KVV02_004879 [Mortierella alpina]
MVKIKKKGIQPTASATKEKRVLQPSPSRPSKARRAAKRKEQPPAASKGKARADSSVPVAGSSSTRTSTRTAAPAPASSSKARETRVLSDEESEGRESAEDIEEEDSDDADRQLGLRPTLRLVSKATVRRSWKPVSIRTRSHVQTLVSSLFPAAISRARGEKRKIAVQMALNRLMQRLNDSLSELNVPPQGKERINYPQLATRNREMEALLVPDLEHIRDLELRLEQEQILAKQDEAELASFREKKQALDQRTRELQRSKLHPLLRDSSLSTSMAALCKADNDHGHLSVADQRLLSLMPTSRGEDFSGIDFHESSYNPDQDLSINKVSKRLGSRLSVIERNGEGLDPLLQLIAVAKDRIRELSATTLASGTT